MQYGSAISFLNSTEGKNGKTAPLQAVIVIVIRMAIIQNYKEVF
jgi:hypothetical protein